MSTTLAILKILTPLAKPLASFGIKKAKELPAIHQLRIEQALESSIAEVWDSLSEYFKSENVTQYQSEILARECYIELIPFAEDPQLLVDQSLDGEKLFENLRKKGPFPKSVVDESLEAAYRTVFPLIATILFRSAVISEQLDKLEFPEILKRLDLISSQIATVISDIQQIRRTSEGNPDKLYERVLQQALKRALLDVEVTGLYGDAVLKQAKEDMFVIPKIKADKKTRIENKKKVHVTASRTDEHNLIFLQRSARSLIRGGPGAGKSTWSRWLQVCGIRDRKIIALCIRLRACQDNKLPIIIDLVRELVGPNMAQEIGYEEVLDWVSKGKVAIILDGLDEISPASRALFVDQINELSDYNENGPFILTSRPLNDDRLGDLKGNWEPFSILPFDRGRIVEYIKKWYHHTLASPSAKDINASDLYEVLTKDPHIAPLTGNPLMLATLLMVHHNDGQLPKGRSKLYGRYIDGMLGIWDDKQKVKADVSGLNRDQKKRILTALAISLHMQERDELDDAKTLAVVESAIRDFGYNANPHLVLDGLRERSGLIVGPGSYSFSHKSIGEYLVSQAICDGNIIYEDQKLDRYILHLNLASDRWLNVIYFWAGSASVSEVETLVKGISVEKHAGLILGIIWDQLDRFHKGWIRQCTESCLSYLDKSLRMSDQFSKTYYAWNFGKIPRKEEKWARITSIDLRHFAIDAMTSDIALGEVLRRIDFSADELNSLRNDFLYNVCVSSLMPWWKEDSPKNKCNACKEIPRRWPLWLKKSQSALRLAQQFEDVPIAELLSTWEECWDEAPGTAVLWFTAAVVIREPVPSPPDKFFRTLASLVSLEWSDKIILSSEDWNVFQLRDGQPKDMLQACLDLVGDQNVESTEVSELSAVIRNKVTTLLGRRKNSNW